jgi:O-antigen/teichoic acid export membrane protein
MQGLPLTMRFLPARWAVLLESSASRQIAANSAWLIGERLIRALLGLLVGAWVARQLGPANFGAMAYVLAYVALFMPLATLSADAIVVRNIAQEPEQASQTLGSLLVLRVSSGLLLWLLSVSGMAAVSRDARLTALTAIAGGLLLCQAADVVDLWFQSQTQSKRTVAAKLAGLLVASAIKVGLILAGAPLEAFVAVTVLEAALVALALAVSYRRFGTGRRWTTLRSVCRATLREAWPFMFSGCAIAIYMRIDQIMVKEMLGAAELGVYVAAVTLSQLWQMVPLTLSTSLAPFLARQKVGDAARYERSVVVLFRAFFYSGVVVTVMTLLVSNTLIDLLFGSAYAASASLLKLHVASNVFTFLGIAHSLWLTNERQFAVRLWGTIFAAAATVAINFLLLPRIGAVGACVAAIASQAIAALLINSILDRRGFRLQIEAITFIRV